MGAIQPKVGEPATDELALVEAAKAGDVGAFEELVRRYDRNIFRIAQHITQNREDAEDVVQDAFFKAYSNLGQFQGQSKFYTWLVRIAVNEALMKLRRRRPERTVSLDEEVKTEDDSVPREVADWSPNPEQQYTQAELRDILDRTIHGLPASFRTVFVLRDVEGLSTEETAEALNLSIPAVKSRLLRARLQLRERLNKYFQRREKVHGLEKPTSGDGNL
jgi:RNA polymerase sigma-70 factor (ECF subfamily)